MAAARRDWDETWMRVAETIGERSRCSRRQCGSVIVSTSNRVIAVGYNGPPAGYHVLGTCGRWCPRAARDGGTGGNNYDNCLTIHAETNALLVCDRRDREGGTMYVHPGWPCFTCAKAIANSGLARVVVHEPLPQDVGRWELSYSMMLDSGLEVVQL